MKKCERVMADLSWIGKKLMGSSDVLEWLKCPEMQVFWEERWISGRCKLSVLNIESHFLINAIFRKRDRMFEKRYALKDEGSMVTI